MSTKRNKKMTNVVEPDFPEVDPKEELQQKLDKMIEDRDKKCAAAKTQLVDMLDVTVNKYLTATGVAEAFRILEFLHLDNERVGCAAALAIKMADYSSSMKKKVEELSYEDMDKVCEGFYDEDFANKIIHLEEYDAKIMLAEQMMCIDLCRNVGGAAEDMVSFVKRVEEEIEATKKALADLEEEEREEEK